MHNSADISTEPLQQKQPTRPGTCHKRSATPVVTSAPSPRLARPYNPVVPRTCSMPRARSLSIKSSHGRTSRSIPTLITDVPAPASAGAATPPVAPDAPPTASPTPPLPTALAAAAGAAAGATTGASAVAPTAAPTLWTVCGGMAATRPVVSEGLKGALTPRRWGRCGTDEGASTCAVPPVSAAGGDARAGRSGSGGGGRERATVTAGVDDQTRGHLSRLPRGGR